MSDEAPIQPRPVATGCAICGKALGKRQKMFCGLEHRRQGLAPDKKYWWPKGVSGNQGNKGLGPEAYLKREIKYQAKKLAKQFVLDHEQKLAEALPSLRPKLIAGAKAGNLGYIKEIHQVVGAYKKDENPNITAVQINFGDDKKDYS